MGWKLFVLSAFAAGGAEAFALGKGLFAKGCFSIDIPGGFEGRNGFQELGFCGGVVGDGLAVAAFVLLHEQGVEEPQANELAVLIGGVLVSQQFAAFFYAGGEGGIVCLLHGDTGAKEEEVGFQAVFLGIFMATAGVFVVAGFLQGIGVEFAQGDGGKGAVLIGKDGSGEGGDTALNGARLRASLLRRFAFLRQGDVFALLLRGVGQMFLDLPANELGVHVLCHENMPIFFREQSKREQGKADEERLHSARLMVMRLKRDSVASDSVAMPGILANSLWTRRRW